MKITAVIIILLVTFCAITAKALSQQEEVIHFKEKERIICDEDIDIRGDGYDCIHPDEPFIIRNSTCTTTTYWNWNRPQACQQCRQHCPCGDSVRNAAPCALDSDCASNRTCLSGSCLDPCDYFRCASASDLCVAEDHRIKCIGGRVDGQSCSQDKDCPADRACVGGGCVDLCSKSMCEGDMVCRTANHKATCSLKTALSSDWPPPGAGKKTFYLNMNIMTDWHSAYMHCLRNNSRLARIENQQENDIVVDMIKRAGIGYDLEYWLGAMDFPQVGQYFWLSTGQLVQGYSNWHPGQGSAQDQRCLTYWQSSEDVVMWNDFLCHTQYNFVCEYYE